MSILIFVVAYCISLKNTNRSVTTKRSNRSVTTKRSVVACHLRLTF
ncbi:MAG: hypothetical protein FWG98_03940 [Candidatus Cloacimonetes bacterium]|nr:hypothetical protein [Candidatus Cloacimonadota bacterium]